ncbi:pyridoxal phosphate-dependent transferase [Aspergillus pseudodeflectus]|uniref:Pyridoxal phosphate-dependent transferase n=1 Tax=Aspergillus pseudodeflectus TaxID=176178 RepID=A0ABR4KWS4_9EURO
MVKIDPFEVDHWILTRSAGVKHNLAHSYCSAISVNDLGPTLGASENAAASVWSSILAQPMSYGPMKGSAALRSRIAELLYSDPSAEPLSIENIVTTPGASLANFLVLFALLGPGDHVVVQYPTYQQLYSLPAAIGAEVSLWKAHEEDGWRLDLDELKQLIRPNTKMIVLNNPVNPTGAALSRTTLEEIIKIAREHSIIILSDEVYYPLFHSVSPIPPSIISLGYDKVVATSSLSKAYSLAGLRVGWIASRDPSIIDLCVNSRSYALITLSQVDEHLASLALSPPTVQHLLERNTTLSKRNVQVVQDFIDQHSSTCQWVQPAGAPIGFVKFVRDGRPIDDVEFCTRLLEKKSVLLVPGSKCFGDGKDFQGYVRLGFGEETGDLKAALHAVHEFLDEEYGDLPVF